MMEMIVLIRIRDVSYRHVTVFGVSVEFPNLSLAL
jgi:hypothetical protein